MDPTLQNKIRHMVEVEGMTPDELLKKLHEDAERQLIEQADEEERRRRGVTSTTDLAEFDDVPKEIQLIAQALAYRVATIDDLDELHKLLSLAYKDEVNGNEAFRIGESVSKESVEYHLSDPSYQWLLVEAPNGHGILRDGDILGACCYSTDGVSKKNGVVEGNVGSIRYFAILPRFRGLCIGRRLLQKIEETIFKTNCIFVAASIPSPRDSMMTWISNRGYDEVRSMVYPFAGLRHSPFPTLDPEEIFLVQFVKANPHYKKPSAQGNAVNIPSNIPVNTPPQPAPQPKKKIPLPPQWRQSEMIISEEVIQDLNGLKVSETD
jgi:ribosomal protein S18 acetylase RimI-like enzyme